MKWSGRTVGAVAALATSVAVAWLPWVRSGASTRNSYEALRSAQRLGLESFTPFRVIWFLVPVLAGASVLAGLAVSTRAMGIGAIAVGSVVIAAGVAAMLSPADVVVGPYASVVVGAWALAAGLVLALRPQGVTPS